jgi:hypothetical protein
MLLVADAQHQNAASRSLLRAGQRQHYKARSEAVTAHYFFNTD